MDRPLTFFKVKAGFASDREFVKLMFIAKDAETYYASIGLWLTMLDEAHRSDQLRPADPHESTSKLVELLQQAQLLDSAGAVNAASFAKYRMPDLPRVLGGFARAASARRNPDGSFAPAERVGDDTSQTPADQLRGRRRTIEDREVRTTERTGPTKIDAALEQAPWNRRVRGE